MNVGDLVHDEWGDLAIITSQYIVGIESLSIKIKKVSKKT